MTKENKSIYYCIRLDASMYASIHKTAEQEQVKPSKLIRQIIKESLPEFGTLKTWENLSYNYIKITVTALKYGKKGE